MTGDDANENTCCLSNDVILHLAMLGVKVTDQFQSLLHLYNRIKPIQPSPGVVEYPDPFPGQMAYTMT